MDLTDATSIVQSVTNGLLVVAGIGAAVALMLAVVRYFTNGANPNARQQLITRCIHVVGAIACIGLVLNFATPFAASLMENSVSAEIASDAKSSNSWLPQVEVNGKKYNVPNGNDVAKSKNLGEALKRIPQAAIQSADSNVTAYNLLSPTQQTEYEKAVKKKNNGAPVSVINDVTGAYDSDATIAEMEKILSVKDWLKSVEESKKE